MIWALVVTLATGLVFSQVYHFSFVTLDDSLHVYNHSRLHNFGLSDLVRLFTAPYQGLYIPVTYLCWWLQISFVKTFPRFASAAPFLCLMEDHLLCPDIITSQVLLSLKTCPIWQG